MINQNKFYRLIYNNDIENIKFFLKDKNFNPSLFNNISIIKASELGHLEIVKLFLNDKRINPSDKLNSAITFAFKNKHFNIVNILWQDQRIKNSLEKDNKELYNNLIFQDNIENF